MKTQRKPAGAGFKELLPGCHGERPNFAWSWLTDLPSPKLTPSTFRKAPEEHISLPLTEKTLIHRELKDLTVFPGELVENIWLDPALGSQ